MKRVLTLVLLIVLLALCYQLYQLYLQNRVLKENFSLIKEKVDNFNSENLQFQADLEYFADSENLEKELRSRFNYKKPGEKMIIVVPPKSDN